MREIDLILLEALMRRNLETNRTAVAVQTASMMIVALFFFGAFLYALTHRDPMAAATKLEPPIAEIGSFPGYSTIAKP